MKRSLDRPHARPGAATQRGVVLLFSLISLVVLLIAAAALMRSFNTSLFMAGNIAFKRDLQNQGDLAVNLVKSEFNGALTAALRASDQKPYNYSAKMLPVNSQGIPTDLALDSNTFLGNWTQGDLPGSDPSVQIRYVIDRLCTGPGDPASLGPAACVVAGAPPSGGSDNNQKNAAQGGPVNKGAAQYAVIYRVSMRVTGPRNTQAYFQSTIAAP